MAALEHLDLSRNNLSGKIPSSTLPPDLGRYSMLEVFQVASNYRLIGQLPQHLGDNGKLIRVVASDNNLSGQLPKSLGNCNNLIFLNVQNNRFSRNIPSGLWTLLNMGSLLLSNNSFIGELLERLSRNLSQLEISHNRIYRKREQVLDLTWELTSFQRLNFTESDILSRLIDNNVIGSGGSRKVYRVAINPSGEIVAVKKTWNKKKVEQKLEKEFLAEVKILSSIRHSNIVKLLCCISSTNNSKLLVYEYLENRSLDLWLHRKSSRASTISGSVQHVVLDWPKRFQIAVGAARGLSYTHDDCSPPIVHRDVKSSNILL
ncbi:LRR receptor-like serine/threonine-protein kinase HSL2 [Alnus glutinosa]|uniref:LRR receptor-like serine/threonine-protein kinase HSL2 n=1 Tax=Alnus glutinosa TaxID=3517 RepID=UPI002D781590|nr:LRR receptor-like serine/threonine-protein kinase HSL2 [Alnus glutinosa]